MSVLHMADQSKTVAAVDAIDGVRLHAERLRIYLLLGSGSQVLDYVQQSDMESDWRLLLKEFSGAVALGGYLPTYIRQEAALAVRRHDDLHVHCIMPSFTIFSAYSNPADAEAAYNLLTSVIGN